MGTGEHRKVRIVGAALLATALALGAVLVAATPVAGVTTFPVRMEAGPHPAVAFSSTWAITATRTMTIASPATVTGSRRVSVPGRGVYLRIASGTLAGWWAAESRTTYRPGIVATAVYAPARTILLPAARYELYRFDAYGEITAARSIRSGGSTQFVVDRTDAVQGERELHIASGTWAGWWIPGTLSAPTPIRCTAGGPPAATTGRTVRSVSAAVGEIALTFDMGGRLTPAMSIIRYLERERVCATIFPTGAAATTTIGRQVMAEIRAHPELFEVGNHTQHHCNLRDGGGGGVCPTTRPTAAFATRELTTADAAIAALVGRRTTPYWRPPFGAVDSTLVRVAAAAGYPFTILWSVDTIDWRPPSDGGPTAASVAAKVIANRTAGGIVLMHLGGYPTRNALPAMLTGLQSARYTPTSLSALFR